MRTHFTFRYPGQSHNSVMPRHEAKEYLSGVNVRCVSRSRACRVFAVYKTAQGSWPLITITIRYF